MPPAPCSFFRAGAGRLVAKGKPYFMDRPYYFVQDFELRKQVHSVLAYFLKSSMSRLFFPYSVTDGIHCSSERNLIRAGPFADPATMLGK
jgi:hypothetical protein